MQGSPRWRLALLDLLKIAKGAAIAAAGAGLTWVLNVYLPSLQDQQLINGLLFVMCSAVINSLLKLINDTRPST